MLKSYVVVVFGLAIMMASCVQTPDSENREPGTAKKQEDPLTKEENQNDSPKTEESIPDTVNLEITGNDLMKFNKDELKVHEGQVVVLTLKHVGRTSKESMGHNWVLLKMGIDRDAFGQAAVNANETDHIPQEFVNDIIAHTKMLGGGESDTITFKAPRKGTYTYLCSFPGHYAVMHGKFTVQ